MKKILGGSQVFFNCYPDYVIHDTDITFISNNFEKDFHHEYDEKNKIDYFYWKKNTPEWHINNLLHGFALDICIFLIPEIREELGITMEHLKQVRPVLDKLDHHAGPKYAYYKIIYEAYIENGDFYLTPEQRLKAYESYKKSRSL